MCLYILRTFKELILTLIFWNLLHFSLLLLIANVLSIRVKKALNLCLLKFNPFSYFKSKSHIDTIGNIRSE